MAAERELTLQKEFDPTTRIVVTGMGAITPLGLNVRETWDNLINGRSGIVTHEFDQYPQIHARIAGIVQGFDPKQALAGVLPLKEISNYVHRSAQFSLAATLEALNQAGLLTERPENKDSRWVINSNIIDPEEIATIIGTGAGGTEAIGAVQKNLDNGKSASPSHILHALPERVVTPVTKAFGIKGPEYTIVAACATGNIAISAGIKEIMCGDAKIAIVGATEAMVSPTGIAMFETIRALDGETDPSKAPRPMDKSAGGFVMGEGAGILVLETLNSARRRGAKILAEITGYANTSDAFHDTVPSGEGAERAMRKAIDRSKTKDPNEKTYINSHTTATPTGDPVEILAIKNVYGEGAKNIVGISGTKGATGHLMGATGAVEAVFCIEALETQIMPPTLRLKNPIDVAKGFNLVPKESQVAEFNTAQNNVLGFGGINAVVIFSRA